VLLQGPGIIAYQTLFTTALDGSAVMQSAANYFGQNVSPDSNGDTVQLLDESIEETAMAGTSAYEISFTISIDDNTSIDDADLTAIVQTAIQSGLSSGSLQYVDALSFTDGDGNVTTLGSAPTQSGLQSGASGLSSVAATLGNLSGNTTTILYVLVAVVLIVIVILAYGKGSTV
jgi:hypothetical protein